jgi:hypothetical protein
VLGALLTAVIALAPSGQAAEPFCRPPHQETRMEAYQRIRRRYGFRADVAYIRKLIRRGVKTEDIEIFPVTRREKRYVELRDRIDLTDRASRYLHRRPELSGGISIEDAWPHDPYVLVRLTRERARHTRALRRLMRHPGWLRTKSVAVSERALGRLNDRIDYDAPERDGFYLAGSGPDIDRGVVEIELITKRTDHLAYFRERYGRRVATNVIATERYSPACQFLYDYVADGARLTVGWEAGGGATFDHVEVAERDDRVLIGVVAQVFNGPRAGGASADATVTLSRPLGDRRVIDASTGRRVPRRR